MRQEKMNFRSETRAKYMATDCVGISKRTNMLQHRDDDPPGRGSKSLHTRSSRKLKPLESIVSEDIHERERIRCMPKDVQDAHVRLWARFQSMEFDVMARSQGRRMQTVIKRTTAGERLCAAKRAPK
eukprot:IDg18540t1